MDVRSVMLVDDEAYVTSIVSTKLQRLGYHVRTALDGDDAFRQIIEKVPDLVVTDYQMPILDGFGLASKLKSDPRTAHLPVILLSARGFLLTPEQQAATNIRSILAKPFSCKELVAHIEAMLNASLASEVSPASEAA